MSPHPSRACSTLPDRAMTDSGDEPGRRAPYAWRLLHKAVCGSEDLAPRALGAQLGWFRGCRCGASVARRRRRRSRATCRQPRRCRDLRYGREGTVRALVRSTAPLRRIQQLSLCRPRRRPRRCRYGRIGAARRTRAKYRVSTKWRSSDATPRVESPLLSGEAGV